MALNADQKRKLEELEMDKEGVSFVFKTKQSETSVPTIVIGLGGWGCETVNILKGKIRKNIGKTENIHFLAVDTDDSKDLKQICKNDDGSGHGNLERDETLSLYDPAASQLLARGASGAPADVQEWLNPTFPSRKIDSTGAQGIRQVGRVMLLQANTISSVTHKLGSLITKCKEGFAKGMNQRIAVIIIAGISGGTGSGTIIDFTYLVHEAMAESRVNAGSYDIAAYLSTPDVQIGTDGIREDENLINHLRANGYAALKEIDYYYNLRKHGGVYRVKQSGSYRECRENLFSFCTVIPAICNDKELDKVEDKELAVLSDNWEIKDALSEKLMAQLSDVSTSDSMDKIGMTDLLSPYYHPEENLLCWFRSPEGQSAKFPKAAFYSYSMIDHSYVNIPREEILAYVANRVFEAVYDEWTDLGDVDEKVVADAFVNVGGGTIEGFENYVDTAIITQMQTPIDRRISIPEDMYPKKADFKKNNVLVKTNAEGLAKSFSEQMRNSGLKGAIIDRLKGELIQKVDNYFEKKGPYATVDLLTHKMETILPDGDFRQPFSGILETLECLIDAVNIRKNESMQLGQDPQLWEKIYRQEDTIKGYVFGTHQIEINEYVDNVCELVEKYTIKVAYYDILIEALQDVYNDLSDANNQIWEVYTQVIDVVKPILEKNSFMATDFEAHMNRIGQTYQFDLLNLYESNQKTGNLKRYLDEFVDSEVTRKICEDFTKSMKDHRKKWVTEVVDGEFDAETEVQLIFDGFFKDKIGSNLIEKLVVAAYQPNPVSPTELSEIWEEKGARFDVAIKKAAEEIVAILTNQRETMAHVSDPYFKSDFFNVEYLVIPKETPHIKAAIKAMKDAGNYQFQLLYAEAMCKFILSSQYINLPLFVFDGLKEYDEAYRNAIANGTIGLHMDEKGEDWSRYPNPYIIDKVAMDGKTYEEYKEYKDYKILEEVKKAVDEAIEYGLIYRPVYDYTGEQADYYALVDIDYNKESQIPDFKTMEERVKETVKVAYEDQKLSELSDDLRPVIEAVKYPTVSIPLKLYYVDLQALDLDAEGGREKGRYVPIGDLYKIVRMSITYTNKLRLNLEVWRKVKEVFDKTKAEYEEIERYLFNMNIFLNALRTGLIQPEKERSYNMKISLEDEMVPLINLNAKLPADRTYYLYHAFVAFSRLEKERIDAIHDKAIFLLESGNVWDTSLYTQNATHILSEEPGCLGEYGAAAKLFEDLKGTEMDYSYTDDLSKAGSAYNVLKAFYYTIRDL